MVQSRWAFLRRVDWRIDLLGCSIVYLVEGMLDMASLAVSYYCKDNLKLGPADAGLFQTAGQIPWELTPLLGLLTDLVPICGYRRKAYLLLVGLLGSACWGGLSALSGCPTWLAGCLLVGSAACTAWTQVIADAVLVGMSQGASQDVATFYQGLSWVTYTMGAVISAYATGRALDAGGPRPVFALAACGLLLDGACAALITEERWMDGRRGSGGCEMGACTQAERKGVEGMQRVARSGDHQLWRQEAEAKREAEASEDQQQDSKAGAGANPNGGEEECKGLVKGEVVPGLGADASQTTGGSGAGSRSHTDEYEQTVSTQYSSYIIPPLPLPQPGAASPLPRPPEQHWQERCQGRRNLPCGQSPHSAARATCRSLFPAADGAAAQAAPDQPALMAGEEAAGCNVRCADPRAASPACLEGPWSDPREDDLAEPLLSKAANAAGGADCESADAPGSRDGGPSGQDGAAGLVSTVWRTLRNPRILVPAVFIFLWQSCPSPSSAMFYFQYNTLHFSAEFQELVYLSGSFAGVAGVMLYQAFLIRYSLRTMLLWCALLGTSLSATQLLLVTRTNLQLGISDKVFVLGDYAVLKAIAEVMMTPLLALSARLCPPGVEATLYACLYSVLNLSVALSGALGALLTRACGVSGDADGDGDGDGGGSSGSGSLSSLTLLVALCTGSMLLPLPLLAFMPPTAVEAGGLEEDEGAQPAKAAAAGQDANASDLGFESDPELETDPDSGSASDSRPGAVGPAGGTAGPALVASRPSLSAVSPELVDTTALAGCCYEGAVGGLCGLAQGALATSPGLDSDQALAGFPGAQVRGNSAASTPGPEAAPSMSAALRSRRTCSLGQSQSARAEAIRAEAIRAEAIRAEAIRAEAVRAEAIRAEAVRASNPSQGPSLAAARDMGVIIISVGSSSPGVSTSANTTPRIPATGASPRDGCGSASTSRSASGGLPLSPALPPRNPKTATPSRLQPTLGLHRAGSTGSVP